MNNAEDISEVKLLRKRVAELEKYIGELEDAFKDSLRFIPDEALNMLINERKKTLRGEE